MKSRSFWIVNGLALFALQADVALAADGEKPGSFNIFVGDLAVAFWTLLIFGLVLVVLGKFAWKPVLEGLQRREQFIRESLETAKRDRESAEARLREYEQKLVEAREEAGRIVEDGRREGQNTQRKIEEAARAASEAMTEQAKREIAVARDGALRDLYDRSAELATNMAAKILQRQISADDHARLVQETLADLEKRSATKTWG